MDSHRTCFGYVLHSNDIEGASTSFFNKLVLIFFKCMLSRKKDSYDNDLVLKKHKQKQRKRKKLKNKNNNKNNNNIIVSYISSFVSAYQYVCGLSNSQCSALFIQRNCFFLQKKG